jgi:hypothetical protein
MAPKIQLDPDFGFEGLPPITAAVADQATGPAAVAAAAATPAADPLGPLAELPGPGATPGVWTGHGFNAIWRPHLASSGQDRFLELNLTDEKLVFSRIDGPIPNRGLAMHDINMFGVTYLQQINEAGNPAQGLHIEPGIWANVPQTSDPAEPPTVVRMASIPHGTVILAQGVWQILAGGPQHIPDNNILPFFFHDPPPANGDFNTVAANFRELNLSIPTQFRFQSPGVTQDMVKNPNGVIQQALHSSLQGTNMKSRTFLQISTTNDPIQGGGGTANTAFLASSQHPAQGNARAAHVEATFWIETIAGSAGGPDIKQLQYTQLVMLDFNGLHWPHVTVGTLRKQ